MDLICYQFKYENLKDKKKGQDSRERKRMKVEKREKKRKKSRVKKFQGVSTLKIVTSYHIFPYLHYITFKGQHQLIPTTSRFTIPIDIIFQLEYTITFWA